MSDKQGPSLDQLLDELKELDCDWFVFGVEGLKIPMSVLRRIESTHLKNVERCKIDTFQYWLDNSLDISWKAVARALEKVDQLVLATTVNRKYIWPPTKTGTVTTDMMEAEIRANVPVVKRLHKLQDSFSRMMVTIRKHLTNCNLSDITFYLDDIIGTRDFSSCDNIYDLLQQLRERYIDTFNIHTLHRLLSFIKNRELDELVEAYENEKEEFLKHTTVLDFQQAVANKVKPVILKGSAKVTIKVSEELATNRTLKDMENLVKKAFEENQRSLVQLHAEPGSVVMMWLFPDVLIATLTNLSHKNAAVFKAVGVEEVTVDGRSVFHKDDLTTPQGVSEQKSTLKLIYGDYYFQLVDALSNPHTCNSLTTQLHHTTKMLYEKIVQVQSSPQASGSSYLKMLDVEEEPHLLTVLMEKMASAEEEQLQKLAGQMAARMSELKKEPTKTQETSKQLQYDALERQQLEADVRELTKEKKDLLDQLEDYKDDLKAKDDLLIMREKVISASLSQHHKRMEIIPERNKSCSNVGVQTVPQDEQGLLPDGWQEHRTLHVDDHVYFVNQSPGDGSGTYRYFSKRRKDDPLQKSPKLRELMNHVAAMTKMKWFQVGIQLNIDLATLNAYETQSSDSMRCYTNVFAEWKRAGELPYTWATIIEALESAAVSEKNTASNVHKWLTDSQ